MAESVEHATASQKVLGSILGHYLIFNQNQGTIAGYEQIGEVHSILCYKKYRPN